MKKFSIDFYDVIGLFIVAFSIRLLFLFQVLNSPFFMPALNNLDEYFYHAWGLSISRGQLLQDAPFSGMPLYAYFLGFLYYVTHGSVYIAKAANALLGALICPLVYLIGKSLYRRCAGFIAALFYAFLTTSILYEGFIVGTLLESFLYTLSFIGVLWVVKKNSLRSWIFLGILVGMTALARSSIILFAFVFSLYMLYRLRFLKKQLFKLAIFSVFIFLSIAPSALHNYFTSGEYIPFTVHDGINFYIGNNVESKGVFNPPKSILANSRNILHGSKVIAEKKAARALSYREISRFWYDAAFEFISKHPVAWLMLMGRKLFLFISAYEIPDIVSYSFFIQFVPILAFFAWIPHILFPLAVAGIVISIFLKDGKRRHIVLFFVTYMFSICLFFVNTRYTIPIMPLLCIFAGAFISLLMEVFLKKKWVMFAFLFILLLFTATITHIKLFTYDFSVAHNNLGLIYKGQGWQNRAIKEFEKAIEINPRKVAIYINLGHIYLNMGDFLKASQIFETALTLNPDISLVHEYLGVAYFNMQKYGKARQHFDIARELDPSQDSRILQYLALLPS
jgi:4-amino-4-deoxy-L-arabinose transferase-like glycosyltransferase